MTPEQSAAVARIRAVASDRHDFDMLPILRRDVLALLSALEEAQAVRADAGLIIRTAARDHREAMRGLERGYPDEVPGEEYTIHSVISDELERLATVIDRALTPGDKP